MMQRVAWFELPVDDFERARNFYRDVFGWDVQKWDGPVEYWMLNSGPDEAPGINGALTRREHPVRQTTNTVAVDSLDDTLAAVERSGGKLVMEKMQVPGIGWLAYCQDTEGNVVGVLQPEMPG